MKNPWAITMAVLAIIIGGSIWLSGTAAEENNVGVEVISHIKGNAESAVKLVEYSDFQCPACASFQPALESVMVEFGDQISFEYKHFPLPMHRNAQAAARAAEAASQQGRFFEFHDLLFAEQKDWGQAGVPNVQFNKYAEELGLDMDLFKQHLKSSLLRDRIRTETNEGLALGVSGTPTFFLNGKKMEFSTFEGFADQIANAVTPNSASSSEVSSPEVRFGI